MEAYSKDGEVIPSYQAKLNRECVTFGEALRPAGYTTLMSGKWHVTPVENTEDGEPRQEQLAKAARLRSLLGARFHGAGSFYNPVTLTDENTPIQPESNDFYYNDGDC